MSQNTTTASLIDAACAALRQAYETDLPWVVSVEVDRRADADLPQADRRDLYAAMRLCNVQYGPLREVRRRPALSGMRSCIVPHEGGHRIVVVSSEGPVAIYEPDGRVATLAQVLPDAAALKLDVQATPVG